MAIEKIKTGIPGLDLVLKGGLRKNSAILLTGSPGTGKTIMALQYIYNGAKKYGDSGLFISTEEKLDDLRSYAKELGMDIVALEKQGKILLYEKPLPLLKGGISSIDGLIDAIKKRKIKRVALDSIIFFEYLYPKFEEDTIEYRRQVLLFLHKLKEVGVTFLTVSERKITDLDRLDYDILDFVFEGFILTSRIRKGSYFERVLTVAKIRGQDHSLEVYPLSIGKGGVRILSDQVPFSLVKGDDAGPII